MRPRFVLTPLGVVVLALLVSSPAPAKDAGIGIEDNFYRSPFVVLRVGDTVTWRNDGGDQHTVMSYPGSPESFDSSPQTTDGNCTPLLGTRDCIEPGRTFEWTFTEPGTYEYHCKVRGHADPSVRPDPNILDGREQPCGMCGVIVVQAGDQPSPTRSAKPSPSPTASPSPSPSPTETASPSPVPTTTGTVIATGDEPVSGGGGRGGGRAAIALGSIVALGAAGWWTWRRFLAT